MSAPLTAAPEIQDERARREADLVRKAIARARIEADKADLVAKRRAEAIEREERWRAASRELAVPHAAKALELLRSFLDDGPVNDLTTARRTLESALLTATQPFQR